MKLLKSGDRLINRITHLKLGGDFIIEDSARKVDTIMRDINGVREGTISHGMYLKHSGDEVRIDAA